LGWLPSLFQFAFGTPPPHWIYDYVALSLTTLCGTLIAVSPDLIRALPAMQASNVADREQDQIMGSFLQESQTRRKGLGFPSAVEAGVVLRGTGYVFGGGAVMFVVWPFFSRHDPVRAGFDLARTNYLSFCPFHIHDVLASALRLHTHCGELPRRIVHLTWAIESPSAFSALSLPLVARVSQAGRWIRPE
jgi:hypothetical protein